MGLDPLANTLEELWISYNNIEKMKGILGMRKLKVLYMSHNSIDSWAEVQKLNEMESLVELNIVGRLIFLFFLQCVSLWLRHIYIELLFYYYFF